MPVSDRCETEQTKLYKAQAAEHDARVNAADKAFAEQKANQDVKDAQAAKTQADKDLKDIQDNLSRVKNPAQDKVKVQDPVTGTPVEKVASGDISGQLNASAQRAQEMLNSGQVRTGDGTRRLTEEERVALTDYKNQYLAPMTASVDGASKVVGAASAELSNKTARQTAAKEDNQAAAAEAERAAAATKAAEAALSECLVQFRNRKLTRAEFEASQSTAATAAGQASFEPSFEDIPQFSNTTEDEATGTGNTGVTGVFGPVGATGATSEEEASAVPIALVSPEVQIVAQIVSSDCALPGTIPLPVSVDDAYQIFLNTVGLFNPFENLDLNFNTTGFVTNGLVLGKDITGTGILIGTGPGAGANAGNY